MEDFVMEHEKKSLDIREFAELEDAFALADSIVTKNYLARLDACSLLEPSEEQDHKPLREQASLFRVRKIVYDREESSLQKLVNTYASAVGFDSNLVMILDSDGKETALYLGTAGAREVSSARGSAKALCGSFSGNFPGSLGKYEDIVLDSAPLEELLQHCTKGLYTSVASVSGVGSPREPEEGDNGNYIQGMEKLLDTMQGIPFSAVFLANMVSGSQREEIRGEYELLYSKLYPFLKSDLSFQESAAEGVSKTLSKSLSTTLTRSRSSALSAGTSKSHAHTEGSAVTHTNTLGINASQSPKPDRKINLGVHYSHSFSSTQSVSDTVAFGTTRTRTSTVGDARAEGEVEGIAQGTSRTETSGRTLMISYLNKTIQNLLERIDEQLERMKESEKYGMFASAVYFLAADPMAAKMAASAYQGLMNGSCTHVERADINFWREEENVNIIKKYIRKLQHPQFAFGTENVVTPVSLVSGKELAVLMGLPRKSIPGVSVLETAAFGRNIPEEAVKGSRSIELGNLYHMGREEEGPKGKLPVRLDLDSLTMHTFITGSTGAGKSNAVYSLLERVLDENVRSNAEDMVHFMVIEPAKGEYKDKFGGCRDVQVYGTNPKKTELLRLNPFSFPADVHVLEHIDRLVEIFNVCWPMYAAMPAVLKDAIERSYLNAGWDLTESVCRYEEKFGQCVYPGFLDVLDMVRLVMEESRYSADSKGDYTGALCTRIKSLTNGIYGQIFTSYELSMEALFDSNVIVDLSRVGSVETKSLIMGLLIMKMQEYRMALAGQNGRHNCRLKHLTVLEEAHNLLKRTSGLQSPDTSNLVGKSVEMLANSIAEMRTYGEGFVIADQAPGLLDLSVIRNTNTKILLRLPDLSDRELAGQAASLNERQIWELSKLKTGVAAVYQNNWQEPVLCKIHPCRNGEKPYQYQAAAVKKETAPLKAVIDYLLLPAPRKLELDSEKTARLNAAVCKLQLPADVKAAFFRYSEEQNPKVIQALRSRIVYGIFQQETAFLLTDSEKYDIASWRRRMLEKLELNLEDYSRTEQDKILAMLAYEHKERTKTPEAARLHTNLEK